MDQKVSSEQQIAIRQIVERSTLTERDALKIWIQALLEIRDADEPLPIKVKRALSVTATHKVLWPMVKLISKEVKRYGWDNRKPAAKFGLMGAAAGMVVFGGAGAGIAALGGAVGVPLWIVLGAGSTFARMLYSELLDKDSSPPMPKTTYTVVDAEKEVI